jgi:hypothetical protein
MTSTLCQPTTLTRRCTSLEKMAIVPTLTYKLSLLFLIINTKNSKTKQNFKANKLTKTMNNICKNCINKIQRSIEKR